MTLDNYTIFHLVKLKMKLKHTTQIHTFETRNTHTHELHFAILQRVCVVCDSTKNKRNTCVSVTQVYKCVLTTNCLSLKYKFPLWISHFCAQSFLFLFQCKVLISGKKNLNWADKMRQTVGSFEFLRYSEITMLFFHSIIWSFTLNYCLNGRKIALRYLSFFAALCRSLRIIIRIGHTQTHIHPAHTAQCNTWQNNKSLAN